MKRTPRIGILLATAAVVIGAIFFYWPAPELRYEGKTLNQWVQEASKDYPRRNPTAIHALRQMGEPAVLGLAQIVEVKESPFKSGVLAISESIQPLHRFLRRHTATQNYFLTREDWQLATQRRFAALALGDIGPAAKSAIPALVKIAKEDGDWAQPESRAALILIRQEPIEPFINLYQNQPGTNWHLAFNILAALGPSAKQAVPMLLHDLASTNSTVTRNAIGLLGRVGIESPECVAPLVRILFSSDPKIQRFVFATLSQFGSLADPALPEIVKFLQSDDDSLRRHALHCLQILGTRENLTPYRTLIQNATNHVNVSETTKEIAQDILSGKFIRP